MKTVAVVDYGLCNLDSVRRAVEECGADAVVTSDEGAIRSASHVILPGVGSFKDAIEQLKQRHLFDVLRDVALNRHVPFLGICLGMQLMASHGEEGGGADGLDIIRGDVKRLVPDSPRTRVPHVGWNVAEVSRPVSLFENVAPNRDFYFVHSYQFVSARPEDVVAVTPYCGGFTSVVSSAPNVFGVQFHPEKSQKVGFQVLRNFIAL